MWYHLVRHFRKLYLLMRFSRHFLWMKNHTSAKWRLFGTKSNIFRQLKAYDTIIKSLTWQCCLFTSAWLSLVYDVSDRTTSTRIYRWSHLLTKNGNLVAHLMVIRYHTVFEKKWYCKIISQISSFSTLTAHMILNRQLTMNTQQPILPNIIYH